MTPWNTACPDWERRLLAGLPLVPELPLFRAEAARALRVFNRLRLPDVIGTPTFEEAAGDWFKAIVAAIFGSLNPETARRMIQEAFLLVPKKNAKSTGAAGIMVTAAIINRRPEAELLLVAPTKEIADISFRQASGMIKIDRQLDKTFHLQRHIRTITHRVSGAAIQIKAADTDAITGGKQTFTLIDETHVFASKPRAAEVFVELRGALAARPDGFLLQITTQSKSQPAGVFRRELNRARAVRDGTLALPLLPILYELPAPMAKSGAWREPKNFGLVNPNLGRSVDVEFLRREMETAERDGPDQLALFASQHLNVEIGLGLRSDRWPGAEFWERRADKALTLEELLERCDVIVAGIDGGGLDDLFGLALLGRCRETREWLLWSHAWAHTSVLDRRKSIAARLKDFETAGELTIVDDRLDDLDGIVSLIGQVDDAGLLAGVAVDPAGLGEFVDALAAIDITTEDGRVIGVPQGYAMMNSIKTAERKLANGTLRHSGSALMAWCVGNLKLEPTATAIRATKQQAGDAKIDPLMAAFNAVALMMKNPESSGSIYDTPERAGGFLVL